MKIIFEKGDRFVVNGSKLSFLPYEKITITSVSDSGMYVNYLYDSSEMKFDRSHYEFEEAFKDGTLKLLPCKLPCQPPCKPDASVKAGDVFKVDSRARASSFQLGAELNVISVCKKFKIVSYYHSGEVPKFIYQTSVSHLQKEIEGEYIVRLPAKE